MATAWREYDLILHIGAPKTGTSAIQKFCNDNRAALLAEGFFYPKHYVDKNGVSSGHADIFISLQKGNTDAAVQMLRSYLDDAAAKKRTLLLSSEGFYANADAMRALLSGLKVGVIAWFREPVSYCISRYNQAIKRGREFRRLDDYLIDLAGLADDSRMMKWVSGTYLHQWADLAGEGNFRLHAYSREKYVEAPLEYELLRTLGVPEARYDRFSRIEKSVNRGYVASALEFKRMLNSVTGAANHALAKRLDLFLQSYSDHGVEPGREMSGVADTELLPQLYRRFDESNRKLFMRFPALGEDFGAMATSLADGGSKAPYGESAPDFSALLGAMRERESRLYDLIRSRVEEAVFQGRFSLCLFELADALAVSYEKKVHQQMMTPARLSDLFDDDSVTAAELGKAAIEMEQAGDIEAASRLVRKAQHLDPSDPGIAAARRHIAATAAKMCGRILSSARPEVSAGLIHRLWGTIVSQGGPGPVFIKAWDIWRQEGFAGLKRKLSRFFT